jgi:hypothetical protein
LRQHLPHDALREMQKPFEIRRCQAAVILDRVVDEGLGEEDPGIVDQNRSSAISTTAFAVSGSAMSPSTRARRSDVLISADRLTRREVATTL